MEITIEIPDDEVELIGRFLASPEAQREGSHGPLDMQTLIDMLVEDLALMVSLPESWPGTNMRKVVASHGYGKDV